MVTLLAQFFSSQVLQLVNEDIRVPNSHVGNVRFLPKECLEGCDIACAVAHSTIDGMDHSCKSISPEKVRGSNILQQCLSFVKDSLIRMFCDPILFWSVWNGEFHINSLFSTVQLESFIDILSSLVSAQDLHMGAIMIDKQVVKTGEPGSEVRFSGTG